MTILSQNLVLKIVNSVITGDSNVTMILLLSAVLLLCAAGIIVVRKLAYLGNTGSSDKMNSKKLTIIAIASIFIIAMCVLTANIFGALSTLDVTISPTPNVTVSMAKSTGDASSEKVTIKNNENFTVYLNSILLNTDSENYGKWECKYEGKTIYSGTKDTEYVSVDGCVAIEAGKSITLVWSAKLDTNKVASLDGKSLGQVNYKVEDVHNCQKYEIQDDGEWDCVDCGRRYRTTNKPYALLVDQNGQPIDESYIELTDENVSETAIGNGTVVKVGNKVTYNNAGGAQSAVIRTHSSSAELVVNAPNDTVKHYDIGGNIHIIAVDKEHCFEEHGKANFTQVDSGKYVTTENAEVTMLYVTSSSNVSVSCALGNVEHAHTVGTTEANALNSTNPGVVFDYDGNVEQASLTDVYHHVDETAKLNLSDDFDNNKVNFELEIFNSDGDFVCNMSLGDFRNDVNKGNTYEGYTIVVLQDLDYSGEDWVPIGYKIYGGVSNSFQGIFDGDNHTIKVKNNEIDECDYFGFFGEVYNLSDETPTKRIYDLNLDVDFTCSHTEMPYNVVGGLASEVFGWVDIQNVKVTGSIVSNRVAGGLVGNVLNYTNILSYHFKNCTVNADVSAFSVFDSDNWLCVGGIVGQNACKGTGLTIDKCSYKGALSTDFTGHTSGASSYMGYVMAKGATDGGEEVTVITDFTVGNNSTITGYQNVTTHDYPFEGLNTYDSANTYSGTPNHNKELVGGYFYSCTIDGVTTSGGQNLYPHGKDN